MTIPTTMQIAVNSPYLRSSLFSISLFPFKTVLPLLQLHCTKNCEKGKTVFIALFQGFYIYTISSLRLLVFWSNSRK